MKLLYTNSVISIIALNFILAQNASADSTLVDHSPHFGETGWEASILAIPYIATENLTIYKRDDKDFENGIAFRVEASYIGEEFYFKLGTLENHVNQNLVLGYTLIKNQDWAIDALLSPRFFNSLDNDLLEDAGLDDRNPDLHLGLRYSRYFEDSLIGLDVSQDISNRSNGFAVGASYNKEWQLKNWIVTGSAAMTYFSSDFTDHFFGVDSNEASGQFPVYRADASLIGALILDAEYPLAENWTIAANLAYILLNSEIEDSPITIDDDSISVISAILRYHF